MPYPGVTNSQGIAAVCVGVYAKFFVSVTPTTTTIITYVWLPWFSNSSLPAKYRYLFEKNSPNPYADGHGYQIVWKLDHQIGMKVFYKPVRVITG